ncbi:MAG: hypothetical protein ACI9E1_001875 [Cryomorphaceae bacterium]|jgi:hypothetical protein
MSRRQRKKTSTRNKEKKHAGSMLKRLWWKVSLGFSVLLVAAVFLAYNRAIGFLHSEAFRNDISAQVGAEIGSVVTFGDFKWDGLSAKNSSFKSSGEGAITEVDAENIALDVKLDYIKRDKFRLKNVTVGYVSAELDLRKDFLKFDLEKKEKGFIESLLPDEVELIDAQIESLNALVSSDSGLYGVSGVRLKMKKKDDSYVAIIEGGEVNLPFSFLSNAKLEQGELTQVDEEIYVKGTKFKIFKSGTITVNGVIDLSPRARHLYDMKADLSGLRCTDVFPETWDSHLEGEVRGEFKIRPHEGTEPKIVGSLEIRDGTLKALRILETVSEYLKEKKYLRLKFQKFECDFEKFDDHIDLRNIVLISQGLVQIEGDLKIDGENIDGLFNVGVPASYIINILGEKNGVFTPGKDQLLWTKVKIGGNFDDITEDLSDRLIIAGGLEFMRRLLKIGGQDINPETIEKLLKSSQDISPETIEKLMKGVLKGDKGILGEGMDTAQGILNGITGSNKKDDKEKDHAEKDDEEKKDGGLIPDLKNLLPFL